MIESSPQLKVIMVMFPLSHQTLFSVDRGCSENRKTTHDVKNMPLLQNLIDVIDLVSANNYHSQV